MILKIKEQLYGNEEKIKMILEEIGCYNIHKTGKQFMFGIDDEGNRNGNSLIIENLHYKSFSRDVSGDILTLVSFKKNITLGDSIKWTADKLGIKNEYTKRKEVILPFDGFFKDYTKIDDSNELVPKIYNDSILQKYTSNGISKLFIDDGISAITQEYFGVGYDLYSDRITIPWRCEYGIIGIMGRKNKFELGYKEQKYLPIIDFRKSYTLYGFYENYKDILSDGYVIICESEKSTMKGKELGLNVVSIGCNTISVRQSQLIKSMFCKVIIALDEGISFEHCLEQAKKVQINNIFFKNEVHIVDMDNPYVTKNKIALLDLDRPTIDKILKEYVKII
jgi:hypothetical protein